MNFLQYDFELSDNNAVQVSLNSQANVRLMDHTNFQYYKSGRQHKYYGGRVVRSPFVVKPPHAGHWYLAIDLGGHSGRISASVSVI